MFIERFSRTFPNSQNLIRVHHKAAWVLLIFPMLFLVGCALMTHYDPTSYKTATDLKAESLLLMDKATEAPDSAHLVKIDDMRVKLAKAYEYEKGKEGPNEITVKQWELLNNPDRDLLGGFLKSWEGKKGKPKGFSKAFVDEKKDQIGKAFDQIIQLESAKVKN